MQKLFCIYSIALKLKELGFDEPCLAYYTNDKIYPFIYDVRNIKDKYINETKAPLWQQAIEWLLLKLDFEYPYIKFEIYGDGSGGWVQSGDENNEELDIMFDNINEGILKGIELIKF